jgi:hypothetical protein
MKAKTTKTYNSGYSPVVTHLTTNPPVHCLSTAERTGSSIFSVLWSYVEVTDKCLEYIRGANGWATWGAIHDRMLGSPGPPTSRLQGFWVGGSRVAELRVSTLSFRMCRRQQLGLGLACFLSFVCSRFALTWVINEQVNYSARDCLKVAWRTSVLICSTAKTDKFRVGMVRSLEWDEGVVADTLRPSGLDGGRMGYGLA